MLIFDLKTQIRTGKSHLKYKKNECEKHADIDRPIIIVVDGVFCKRVIRKLNSNRNVILL